MNCVPVESLVGFCCQVSGYSTEKPLEVQVTLHHAKPGSGAGVGVAVTVGDGDGIAVGLGLGTEVGVATLVGDASAWEAAGGLPEELLCSR